MTLNDFIAKKPAELRLGQWFVNCYCKPVKYWDIAANELFQLDSKKAERYIIDLMYDWQWSTLPDDDKNGNKI